MDFTTLIAIVVAVVVKTIAEKLISSIEGWLKTTSSIGTVMTIVKKSFTRHNISPFLDALAMSLVMAASIIKFNDQPAIAGKDVPDLLALAVFFSLSTLSFIRSCDDLRKSRGTPD